MLTSRRNNIFKLLQVKVRILAFHRDGVGYDLAKLKQSPSANTTTRKTIVGWVGTELAKNQYTRLL